MRSASPMFSVTSMKLAAPSLPCYLVEWYRPEITEAVDDTVARLDESATLMSAEGSLVQLLMTFAVPADEVVFSVFAAESAQTVFQACQRAGFPAERLTAAGEARILGPSTS